MTCTAPRCTNAPQARSERVREPYLKTAKARSERVRERRAGSIRRTAPPTRIPRIRSTRPGTAMMEFVLIVPLLAVILSLTFYTGRLILRSQHATVMARYETWRDAYDAPGPTGQTDLNTAFFNDNAASIQHGGGARGFPMDALDDLVEDAARFSEDAGDFTETLLFRPPDGTQPRLSHAHGEGFTVTHPGADNDLWRRIDGPINRAATRIGHAWPFTDDPRAGPDTWDGGRAGDTIDHRRAGRDAFYPDLDDELDALDGDAPSEYASDPAGAQLATDILAGFIRSLYLHQPGYEGPLLNFGP